MLPDLAIVSLLATEIVDVLDAESQGAADKTCGFNPSFSVESCESSDPEEL